MKSFFVITMLCALTSITYGQDARQRPYLNLGFEKLNAASGFPDKWERSGEGYTVKIDSVEKHGGAIAVMMEGKPDRPEKSVGFCGYALPAIYEGRQIELRAWLKLQDVKDGPVLLMLRIDGEKEMLQYENMEDQKLQGTRDWALYSVKLPLPAEYKQIVVAGMLSGTGKVWTDDFEVLIDGQDISKAQIKTPKIFNAAMDKEFDRESNIASIPLDTRRINNLDVLGKVWGYVKYYHPAVNKGQHNWDAELFRVLPKIMEGKNDKERNETLVAWIDKLGEVKTGKAAALTGEVKIQPDIKWTEDVNLLGEQLSARLTALKDLQRDDAAYYAGIAPAGNPDFRNENPYVANRYPDAGLRLLALYRYWNIIQYCFPYRHLIEEDWKKILPEFIPAFVNAANELEYKKAALSLIARVHDTHASIWGTDEALENFRGVYFAPVEVKFIDNKAVVARFLLEEEAQATGLKKGDVITAVNGVRVSEIVKQRLPITPASNYPTQLRNIARDLLRSSDSVMNLTYERDKKSYTVKVPGFVKRRVYENYKSRDTCFKYLTPDIAYFYPGTAKNSYFEKIMPDLLKTKGMIIDFRCYPSFYMFNSFGKYLMPEAIQFIKFTHGGGILPGAFSFKSDLTVGNNKKNPEFYKGKVVIIVNEETQSAAEFTTMAWRVAPRATVIGSTTAGADGNMSWFYLPGGIQTGISGIGVYYPDKRETQRVGIVPDITVQPTIKGIAQGRDEVLEKAIEIINEK